MSTSELFDVTAADVRNARFLARACDLAYLGEPAGPDRFRAELGLQARLISVDNTQVYVGENERALVVVFRGSESPVTFDGLKDWLLTNAYDLLVLPEGRIGTDFAAAGVGARFHKGFMHALSDIWDPLYAAVDAAMQERERPLWVAGHSLGGALALLAAWRFQRQFLSVHQVYTFGSPMIGNAEAAGAFEREFAGRIFRYADEPDPVPLLPTVSLLANSYSHCPTGVGFGTTTEPATRLFQKMSEQVADGSLNATLVDELWNLFRSRFDAHSMANYLARLETHK
jgi:triacylglycerol lipase